MERLNYENLKPLLEKIFPYGYAKQPLVKPNRFIGFDHTGSSLYITFCVRGKDDNSIILDNDDDPDQVLFVEPQGVEPGAIKKYIKECVALIKEMLPEFKFYDDGEVEYSEDGCGCNLYLAFGNKIY